MKRLWPPLLSRLRQADGGQLWLLLGLTLAIAPHLGDLPPLIGLPSLTLLAWRLLYELKLAPLPPRLLRWLLTFIALGAVFLSFHSLFGRQAGISLLIVMLGLKLTEMNSQRDVTIVIGMGYFVVLTVFMFNQSIFIGLYMLLVVSVLTTALTSFSRSSSRLAQGLNLRLALRLLAQAAPLAILMFILFPRIPGPLWNLPSDSLGASTGLSDSMSPGEISQLSDNDAVAFRVQFEGELPPPEQRYWRGPVFISYDGKSWTHPDFNPAAPQGRPPRKPRAFPFSRFQASGEPTRYRLTLEPHQRHWLFALDLPAELPAKSWLTNDYEIISRTPLTQVTQYHISSYTSYLMEPARILRESRYLQLPESGGRRARQLASELLQQAATPAQVVDAALRYLREQPFYYTRQPPLLPDDPVDQFLFDSRRGYCEHYASVFVFLMRAAGIPARVVTGYQGGEMNPLSDYFIVRQSDAHAWTEVWLQDRGWLRIDPTAVIPAERIENASDRVRIFPELAGDVPVPGWATRFWRQMNFGWDNLNHYWNQWIVNYNQATQKDLLKFLGLGEMDWRGMVTLLMAGIGLLVAGFSLYLLRLQPAKADPVLAAYARFCRKLARRGIVRRAAEGADDFSQRAGEAMPSARQAIANISALYQHLRYAAQPPGHMLRQLQMQVRRFHP